VSESDTEIVVEDPDAPAEESPAVASTRTVETVVYVLLAGLAALLAFDNWRTGMGWEADGPQAGYFPFYLLTQWLGLYVASFLLIAGFMWMVGRIALWKSLLTAFVFSIAMFITFDIAFDVIMPKGPLEALFGY
jgi:putative tricarboxylic transport membrane protein